MERNLKIILTGATGMVGEGVLHECLQHPNVEKVLLINRKPCGVSDKKLTEVIHGDFMDLTPIESQLSGYNACFFCLGVSSFNMKEDQYQSLTYDLTLNVAEKLLSANKGMTFCYVSGAGTDSTENGKQMWARVKGKTENDLMKLPFRKAYMFRPGYLQPTKGLKNHQTFYSWIGFLYPLLKVLFPKYVSTLKELGLAMINITISQPEKQIIEVPDIVEWSKK
ncbi:MAG: NAD-dependent epimerase/dehydratase family protein [Reichenbachiella sp.]|uniref:NAD-dependent epimerase/dehydratase family protein n=1 Tax=Reichenbachiella sp. TaxID=2184521 RepID=UPI00329705DE